jgi:outer membrane protein OmpA-like peptidoglycan-associated protein
MKQIIYLCSLLFLIIFTAQVSAANCRLGADYYYMAKSETDPQWMIRLLYQSVRVCPNFNAWYMLGLIYTEQGQTDQAIEAFIQAETAAGSAGAEALALARRGELLSQTGQGLRALRTLELAKRFHPEPTPQWLDVSLKNARIQTHQSIIPAAEMVAVLQNGTQFSTDGRFAVRPAVNLPVHFDYDRASLNSTGRRQVFELGRALTRIQMKSRTFLLIGHTDKRGTRAYNQVLSENRAYTVKIEVERQFPSLVGKLKFRGRGESQLLYNGDSEVDHMLNRRVKVIIEE